MKTTVKVPRQPLAWGMQLWGPLPGTQAIWLMWDGPGSRITMYPSDPQRPGGPPGRPVEHPTANGIYQTVKAADKAVQALVAAAMCQDCGQNVATSEMSGKSVCDGCCDARRAQGLG